MKREFENLPTDPNYDPASLANSSQSRSVFGLDAFKQAIEQQKAKFPEKQAFADNALQVYVDFMQGTASSISKSFVASEPFQGYMQAQANGGRIGPYFGELLTVLEGDDLLVDYQYPNLLDIFAELDTSYLYLQHVAEQGYSPNDNSGENETERLLGSMIAKVAERTPETLDEAIQTTFSNFQAANRVILNGLRDTEDPEWKSFVHATLPHLYKKIQLRRGIVSYSGLETMQRVKTLFAGVSEENWGFLISYTNVTDLFSSQQIDFKAETEKLDKKILSGDLDEARAIVNYSVYAFVKRKDANDFMPHEQDFVRYWVVKEFMDGELSLDDFKRVPELWDRLRAAYFSLPRERQKSIEGWAEEVRVNEEGTTVIELRLWNSIMQADLLLYKFPDEVIDLVAKGLHPRRRDVLDKVLKKQGVYKAFSGFKKEVERVMTKNPDKETVADLWRLKLAYGEVGLDQLKEVQDAIVRIHKAEELFYAASIIDDKAKAVLRLQTVNLYASPDILKNADTAAALFERGYFPSPNLIRFLSMHDINEGIAELADLKEKTRQGEFDPANLAQRDLEYLDYLPLALKAKAKVSFSAFEQLPVAEIENSQLTTQEHFEVEAAAYEAANLFHFIRGRKVAGRRITAIGNERYGAYFVVEPMRSLLEDESVPISIHYIHSSGNKDRDLTNTINGITMYLRNNDFDDIVIVDGTVNSFQGDTPRLPQALATYAEKLGEKGYHIAHWIPKPEDNIILGNKKVTYTEPSTQRPQIILANPVIDPKRFPNFPKHLLDHKPGFLDDPEKFSKEKTELVFTSRGIEAVHHGHTQEQFINLAQSQIARSIQRYLQEIEDSQLP